ncbi:type VI secretion system baseplate subunit TssE [Gemmatimonas sp.]|uniref:type VI secretion system baseplate subunit TssE n=1 Tax=Gemmatimonas sp. TaxID=1962908 RepID=UPI0035634BBD
MARTELDRAVQPSLLDRLTDEAPQVSGDVAVSREESVRRFRQAVQRDVESLLNTRRCIVEIGPAHAELRRSVHEYGIPDTTGLAVGTVAGRKLLTDDIKDALQRFEPRLMNVTVRLTDSDQVRTPQVCFAIEATLRMDPSPEQIVFDTVLEIASGSYAVDENG